MRLARWCQHISGPRCVLLASNVDPATKCAAALYERLSHSFSQVAAFYRLEFPPMLGPRLTIARRYFRVGTCLSARSRSHRSRNSEFAR